MKLMVIKNNFQVLLVPNYCVFRITLIYDEEVNTYSGDPAQISRKSPLRRRLSPNHQH